ncbi:MAG: M20/M25/M40 family metallo-hydrolase [wastewater metagenome]|nr:M20/M25/M40 family metallo-hydrolase [Candidatus Loosdrechtia aerotolerans]
MNIRKYFSCLCLFLLTLITLTSLTYSREYIHHEMEVLLQPDEHRLSVKDTITLPEAIVPVHGGDIYFSLHSGLQPASANKGVRITPEIRKPDSTVPVQAGYTHVEDYRVTLPAGVHCFTVHYHGKIHHPIQQGEQYARSFSETLGAISPQGVYLSGCSYWYPRFNDDLITFTMNVRVPDAWNMVTQGERFLHTEEDTGVHIGWRSEEPQDELCIAGGRFTEYHRDTNGVQVMAFLRTPDETLADKYLETATLYLGMYHNLIGPYPYKKFAVVENFWETGYGMPSFTLLGTKIIRFPFILHSSYPHEILHNWWGNSVFVDYQTGNWCEGLTAYLADHLIQEQKGTGAEYRRTALQKYTDYIIKGTDFPLAEFRTRHSPVTEAIGYGKAMMFFHMLRLQVGDDIFTRALQKFYRENTYRRASFDDIRRIFNDVTGKNLQQEFDQWITRPGAPVLRVRDTSAQSGTEGYVLSAIIEQVQSGPAYTLQIPIAVTMEGEEYAYQATVTMDTKRLELSLPLPSRPLQLDIDPEFDIFRRLDPYEIPPALSNSFGAEKILILLPSTASKELLQGFQDLGESWQKSRPGKIMIKQDNEIDTLPSDHAVWLLGWENQFLPQFTPGILDYHVTVSDQSISINGKAVERNKHAAVITTRHPDNPNLTLTLLAADTIAAISKLKENLPYYSKYSYLCFEGDELHSIIKGNWPVINSPMSVPVLQPREQITKVEKGKQAPRQPLAHLPLLFSEKRLLRDVQYLASEKLQGRGFGTPGLDMAADYIASEFQKAGLQPFDNTDNSFFQVWEDSGDEPVRQVILKNVIGIIPGSDPELAEQSIVVGAHYDHLGSGWPDVHKGDKGKIHYGADDNASGVAVLLELARLFGKNWKPSRTVVFIAFTGEEAGLRGSRYYVTHEQYLPTNKIAGMVNIDTVGRLEDNKLMIFGTGSAKEWGYIFMGASYTTGVSVEPIPHDFGASDQKSFLDAGIPAVQLFSGPNPDYHRPTDTVDKVKPSSMVKTAKILKEVIEYLAHRPVPLTSTLEKSKGQTPEGPEKASAGRKVSLGTVPDFTYHDNGFRIKGIVPGSPAEKAGLHDGDVILTMNDIRISGLPDFSGYLKKLQPGERISITFMRDGKRYETDAIVEER